MRTKLSFFSYLIALFLVVFLPGSPDSNGIFGLQNLPWEIEKFLNLFLLIPLFFFLEKLNLCYSTNLRFLIAFLSSCFIETIQLWIPYRVSDLSDVIVNSTGVLIFVLLRVKFGQLEVRSRN